MKSARIVAAAVALPLLAPGLAAAQSAEPPEIAARLEALRKRYDEQSAELKDLGEKLRTLENQLRGMGLSAGQVGTMGQSASGNAAAASATTGSRVAQAPAGKSDEVVKEPARSRSVEGLYQQRGAQFTQKFTLEPSLTYSRFDRRLINLSGFLALDAIFLGSIDVQETKSDLFQLDLTGRWGVTPDLQLDVNVPYLYRHSEFFSGGVGGAAGVTSKADVSNGDIGDISVGAFYQLHRESGSWPDVILNARVKAPTGKEPYGIKVIQPDANNNNLNVPQTLPTGSGVWSAGLGASFLKTLDPAIVFGNIGYIYQFPGSFGDISTQQGVVQPGKIDLGNAWLWGLGIGFAVNERMSLSFAYNQLIQQEAKQKPEGQGWQGIVGSDANAATFNFGVTYALSDKSTLITNLGIGLTPDSPDFTLNLRIPYTF